MDLSKLLIYEFHYKCIGVKHGCGAKLLFIHTNRLVYEIKTDDVYEDFYEDRKLLDFSNYPKDSRFYDLVNIEVIGKMRDEVRGKIINEFVGLKSKMYSLVIANDRELNKTKCVNKNIVDKIRHKEYVNVLFSKGLMRHNKTRIQSKLHRIGTYDVYKISVSCFDDKRYIMDDNISSLAYFHKYALG